jgi:hypothetical protein
LRLAICSRVMTVPKRWSQRVKKGCLERQRKGRAREEIRKSPEEGRGSRWADEREVALDAERLVVDVVKVGVIREQHLR